MFRRQKPKYLHYFKWFSVHKIYPRTVSISSRRTPYIVHSRSKDNSDKQQAVTTTANTKKKCQRGQAAKHFCLGQCRNTICLQHVSYYDARTDFLSHLNKVMGIEFAMVHGLRGYELGFFGERGGTGRCKGKRFNDTQ